VNWDLERLLEQQEVRFSRLRKSEKVKILSLWVKAFPELIASARHQEAVEGVYRDSAADQKYAEIPAGDFYILPDDDSGMPSYSCSAAKPPVMTELVSDTITKCEEIIVVDKDFSWSAVFVNHGSPQLVGKHYLSRDESA
jgi:hypothetical protein